MNKMWIISSALASGLVASAAQATLVRYDITGLDGGNRPFFVKTHGHFTLDTELSALVEFSVRSTYYVVSAPGEDIPFDYSWTGVDDMTWTETLRSDGRREINEGWGWHIELESGVRADFGPTPFSLSQGQHPSHPYYYISAAEGWPTVTINGRDLHLNYSAPYEYTAPEGSSLVLLAAGLVGLRRCLKSGAAA